MNTGLEGAVALVTGAGSGIGAASAAALARAGAVVVVTDVEEASAKAVAHEIGGRASAHRLDVSDEDAWVSVVAAVTAEVGPITVLHSNAAPTGAAHMSRDLDVTGMDLRLWQEILDVALTGGMLACKHTIPSMVAAGGGSIVVTSSVKGLTGSTARTAYSCAKGGLDALVRMVATGYGKAGVRCNAIAPGIVETPALRATVPTARLAELEAGHLLPRLGTAADIAETVVFLSGAAGSFITGQVIVVDGGLTAHTPALSPSGGPG